MRPISLFLYAILSTVVASTITARSSSDSSCSESHHHNHECEGRYVARQASRLITVTFTIFWYEHTYYSRIETTATPPETRSGVGFDFTSSLLRLSTRATDTAQASELLKPTADSVSSSKSSSEESASRSMYDVISSQYRSSSRSRAAASSSMSSNAENAANGNNIGTAIFINDQTAAKAFILVIGVVGGMMVVL